MIKSGNKEQSKSTSWKVLETIMSHLKTVLNAFLTITAILLNSVTIQALRKASSLSKPPATLLVSLAFTVLGVGSLCHHFNITFLIKRSLRNVASYPTCAVYTHLYGGPLVPLPHTLKQTRFLLKRCFLCAIVLVFHTNVSLLLRNWPPSWKQASSAEMSLLRRSRLPL